MSAMTEPVLFCPYAISPGASLLGRGRAARSALASTILRTPSSGRCPPISQKRELNKKANKQGGQRGQGVIH